MSIFPYCLKLAFIVRKCQIDTKIEYDRCIDVLKKTDYKVTNSTVNIIIFWSINHPLLPIYPIVFYIIDLLFDEHFYQKKLKYS